MTDKPTGKSRQQLIDELTSAIERTESEWSRDPDRKQMLEDFRNFAAEHDISLEDLTQPPPPSPSPVPHHLRGPQVRALALVKALNLVAKRSHDQALDEGKRRMLQAELDQSQRALQTLESHDQLIKRGMGPYQDITRRLRAQRALRELPSRIKELERMLEA